MELRVRTNAYSIVLVKAEGASAAPRRERARVGQPSKAGRVARHEGGEPGRQYDPIVAEVVGVFHPAADLPEPGERIEADRELGYVEALRLRTPVRSPGPCVFIAQVAEDGQVVEFGETLFVVDLDVQQPAAQAAAAGAGAAGVAASLEEAVLEPPQI